MKRVFFLLLFLSLPVNSAWYVKECSTVCLTLSSLNFTERMRAGVQLESFELTSVNNNCTIVTKETKTMPTSIGVYSKAEMLNYENKRKIYFVNTRDLINKD